MECLKYGLFYFLIIKKCLKLSKTGKHPFSKLNYDSWTDLIVELLRYRTFIIIFAIHGSISKHIVLKLFMKC